MFLGVSGKYLKDGAEIIMYNVCFLGVSGKYLKDGAEIIMYDVCFVGVSGKYLKDGAEIKSSEETLDEEKQKKLWELSGGYCQMEGYEAIEVTQPPPEEEEKPKKEKKEEKKDEEAKVIFQ